MSYYNNYYHVNFETPEEIEAKKKTARRTFSRVFLALFIYVIVAQVAAGVIYSIAALLMPTEAYEALLSSGVCTLLVSSGVQYLIAFPIFLLITMGLKGRSDTVKQRLSGKEFLLLLFIAEALMYFGAIIGNTMNSFIGRFIGSAPQNSIDAVIYDTPTWLLFILLVVVGPIVEELICRKVMIDKLSIFGDRIAIFFSAAAFGMFHMNLYQFFYAALLGILLGYIYTKTRNVKYTIALHMIVNFFGSIVALPVEKSLEWLNEHLAQLNPEALPQLNGDMLRELALNGGIVMLYNTLQIGMVYGGIIAAIYYLRKKKFYVSPDKQINLKNGEIIENGIVNPGAILFIATTSILTIMNLFLT